jgi:hypothetical protein
MALETVLLTIIRDSFKNRGTATLFLVTVTVTVMPTDCGFIAVGTVSGLEKLHRHLRSRPLAFFDSSNFLCSKEAMKLLVFIDFVEVSRLGRLGWTTVKTLPDDSDDCCHPFLIKTLLVFLY